MTKARAKTPSKKPKKSSRAGTGSRKPVDLPAIRQQITNLVGNRALDMVETTVEEAKKGHYAAMKYLFDLIGLHPAEAQEESSGEIQWRGPCCGVWDCRKNLGWKTRLRKSVRKRPWLAPAMA